MSTVTKVYKNVRGIRTAIKDVARLRAISTILARHGFGAVVTSLKLAEVAGVNKIADNLNYDANKYSVAERIRLSVEELGPTFIKLGQILSTRPDLVPADIIEQLQHLQDDVPPMPWDDVEYQVETQLGDKVDSIFKTFSREPLACASIAQVHRATLQDDTQVVVKVMRRNIDDKIDSDLNILHFLAQQSEQLIPELQLVAPVGIIKEFDKALRQELDFTVEEQNIVRFTRNFEKFEGLRAPKVFSDYCTKRILTMEFIKGVKITEAAERVGADPYKVAPTIMKALLKMILKDGHIHGDLHPGNILITDDAEIVLIDFGLCGRIMPSQREAILDLLISVSKEDYEGVARCIFEMGVKVPGTVYDFDAFESDVIEIMEKHVLGKTLSAIDVQAYFADLVAGAIRHNIKMPPTYTMVFKALMTVEGIGKILAPNMNFLDETKPFIQELLIERYNPKRLLKESAEMLGSLTRFVRQLSLTGPQILKDMERGTFNVNVDINNLERNVQTYRKETRLQSRAILTSGLMVSGAMTLDWSYNGLPILSLGAFSIAAILGIPLIWTFLRTP
ncbi:MAG: AarF/ABC1/UbiB kinase family protein [Deltaproteobacteria bacterium]|jgi:ubiquinone biosynthesis protein|nr:AarF/ABC1/UbiB kinase family protein [Deltaproteobacteria bacterium]MBT6489197.1 AarF/ABC1/UbiB kinase family protein [Deltaproteobacteria bacterium]